MLIVILVCICTLLNKKAFVEISFIFDNECLIINRYLKKCSGSYKNVINQIIIIILFSLL